MSHELMIKLVDLIFCKFHFDHEKLFPKIRLLYQYFSASVTARSIATVLKVMQREGNTLSPILRKAWDGGNLASLTKNDRLRSTNPHINLLAHITQYELKKLMSQSDIHNGLANRFLWAYVRRSKKLAFPLPMDKNRADEIASKLSVILKNKDNELEIKFSEDAIQYWNIKYSEISVDNSGLKGSVTSRAETHVLRLSIIFCLLDNSELIELNHIKAGVELVIYCNESVDFLFTSDIPHTNYPYPEYLISYCAPNSFNNAV